MIKNIIIMSIVVLIVSCTNGVTLNISEIPSGGVVLNKWKVLGPFSSTAQANCFDVDNLKKFNLDENTVTYHDFLNLAKLISIRQLIFDDSISTIDISSEHKMIDFNALYNITSTKYYGNVYCYCIIKCKKIIHTRLNFMSDDGEKIWLNNKLICSNNIPKKLSCYEQYIPIELQKGDNTILVKVNNRGGDWRMFAKLENETKLGLRTHYRYFNHCFLNKCIINNRDSIYIKKNFTPTNCNLTILDANNKFLFSYPIRSNISWYKPASCLKNGRYNIHLIMRDITLKQSLFKGDIIDSTKKTIKKLESLIMINRTNDNCNALIYRFNYLLKMGDLGDRYSWERKLMSIFTQFDYIRTSTLKRNDPYKHASGEYIRSYISKIDQSHQYYLLHVPRTYKKNVPHPLLVVLPVIIKKLPYLESFRVANIGLFDIFQDLAEKYNMIIIEIGSRSLDKPNYNTIEETELFDIIKDLNKDYNVNSSKVYLSGVCAPGKYALELAEKFPDQFAAIGIIAPAINYDVNYDSSIQQKYPNDFLKNISNTPVLNIHNVFDLHTPISISEKLYQTTKREKLPNYNYIKQQTALQLCAYDYSFDDIIRFLNQFSLNRSPKVIDFATNQLKYNKSFWITLNNINYSKQAHIHAEIIDNKLIIRKENIQSYSINLNEMPYDKKRNLAITDNGLQIYDGIPKGSILPINPQRKNRSILKSNRIEGPLAHIFTQKFILVRGCFGSKLETAKLKALANTLNNYWYERYYCYCTIKNDFEINRKDISESNLLLLGNARSNQVVNIISKKLPIKLSNHEIQISNVKAVGTKLGFYFIYPNPLNRDKYIAIIGYNNPEYITLGSDDSSSNFLDVSNYGWYDYKVWDAVNPMHVITSGYFNSVWN